LIQRNDETVIRVIVLDNTFFNHLIAKKSFTKVTPFIRGREETYYELPPEHETIISLEEFISKLKEI